jgi:hypothetical protein
MDIKPRVMCVLRSGREYGRQDVAALDHCLKKFLPGFALECLSDVDVPVPRIPLTETWPGWWSKMELFRPDIEGDIFYLDLDTVVVRPIEHLAAIGKLTMLSDFYYPQHIASGLMYLPQSCREVVWKRWIDSPRWHMDVQARGGDQGFLREIPAMRSAARWQQAFPDQVISYKVHLITRAGRKTLPDSARIVCFHGQPRPRSVEAPWIDRSFLSALMTSSLPALS